MKEECKGIQKKVHQNIPTKGILTKWIITKKFQNNHRGWPSGKKKETYLNNWLRGHGFKPWWPPTKELISYDFP